MRFLVAVPLALVAIHPFVSSLSDKTALSYLDRSRARRGMVTPAVVAAFASVGWGGSWTGSTKDYMHFSSTGH